MNRAILTGFEPFGPYKYNPVMDLAREYDGKNIGGIEVVGVVLPCTYFGAFDILSKKIDELSPDVVLGTGLASRVLKIRLEAIGHNIMNGKYADADGLSPCGEEIIKGGNHIYKTNADNISSVVSLKAAGIDSEVSINAEGFICNSLIYQTARRITEEKLPIKFAFFHTPWTDDYLDRINLESGKIAIPRNTLIHASEILINKLIAQR